MPRRNFWNKCLTSQITFQMRSDLQFSFIANKYKWRNIFSRPSPLTFYRSISYQSVWTQHIQLWVIEVKLGQNINVSLATLTVSRILMLTDVLRVQTNEEDSSKKIAHRDIAFSREVKKKEKNWTTNLWMTFWYFLTLNFSL